MPLSLNSEQLPVLPLRDVVVFPHMVIPLFVGWEKSIRALEFASEANNQVLLVAQKDANTDDPNADDLYQKGCLANILQMLKLPDGNLKVLVEGCERVNISALVQGDEFMIADYAVTQSIEPKGEEKNALVRSIKSMFENYIKLN